MKIFAHLILEKYFTSSVLKHNVRYHFLMNMQNWRIYFYKEVSKFRCDG